MQNSTFYSGNGRLSSTKGYDEEQSVDLRHSMDKSYANSQAWQEMLLRKED